MPFELSEEQELVRRTAREFADKVLQPLAEPIDREGRFPAEVQRGLAELGFWGLAGAPEHGGAGLGPVSLVVALEELARRSASVGAVVLAHNAALPLLGARAARLAGGEGLASLCVAEGPLASGLRGRDALSGAARLFPLAGEAEVALAPHPAGGFAVLPKGLDGVAWVPEGTMGLRGARLGQAVLRNARAERVEGEVAPLRSLGLAALAVGLGQAGVEEATRFAKDRVQFGKPIASFEGVRARLADMATATDAARALTLQAAAFVERGEPAQRLAAQAKVMATEAASQSTRLGIKLHGGSGFLKDFAAERLNRDARMLPLLGGESAAQRDLAGRALLG